MANKLLPSKICRSKVVSVSSCSVRYRVVNKAYLVNVKLWCHREHTPKSRAEFICDKSGAGQMASGSYQELEYRQKFIIIFFHKKVKTPYGDRFSERCCVYINPFFALLTRGSWWLNINIKDGFRGGRTRTPPPQKKKKKKKKKFPNTIF